MNIIVVNRAAHNVVIAGNLTERQKAYLAKESRCGSAHYTCVTFNYYEDTDRTLVNFYPCKHPRNNDGEKEVKMTAHYGFSYFPDILTKTAAFLNRYAALYGFSGVHVRVENGAFFIAYNDEAATKDDRAKAIEWAALQICANLYGEAAYMRMLDVLGALDAALLNFTAAAEKCH
ncbi:MAG: hypothetical protein K6F57_01630 [Candidatus Saccharibacteria bacterium]|nr:hypothetical protein [Candidatus Saccharibacteria bacterium]